MEDKLNEHNRREMETIEVKKQFEAKELIEQRKQFELSKI